MHICCANCGLYPVRSLSAKGIEVRGFWYNPNIHPVDEYDKRLSALRDLEALWGLEVEYVDHYGLRDYLGALKGHEGLRCARCYEMRLGETASAAKRMGLDGFTTTLLVSPYQKFDLILEAGRRAEREHSVPFYAEDFRAGWQDGVRLSRELGLYRQNYCGCIYSRKEMLARRNERKEAPAAAATA